MSGVLRGGVRQASLAQKFKVAEGLESHDLEFFSVSGADESKWAMVNTTIGENQRVTLGFQLAYGDDLRVRVKEMFREYVPGAHAHYKFEVLVELKDLFGGSVFVEVPDHRAAKRGQARETGSGAPLEECFVGRVLLQMKRMDGPVEEELQSACLCCA
jgi:hypothetical protein